MNRGIAFAPILEIHKIPFAQNDWVIVSNTLNVKEILKIYLIEQMKYIQITRMSDTSITVIYHTQSLYVLYISINNILDGYKELNLCLCSH
jgi:hypothetical protein